MTRACFLVGLLLALACCASCTGASSVSWESPTATAPQRAPVFNVSLDDDPAERWLHVVAPFKDDYGPILKYVDKWVSPEIQKLLVPLIGDLDKYLGADYGAELRGIAKASGLELGYVVALNIIYSVSAFCTSIVAQAQNGTIFHSRNLDYPIPGLRAITIQVNFIKDGQLAYSGTTFAGYAGLLTGVRPGVFALSVDQRMLGTSPIDNILELLFNHGHLLGIFLRDTLQNATSYASAVETLSATHLAGPVYIAVSGVNAGEGTVIARNRSDVAHVDTLDADDGKWYVLETNYDWWAKPPGDGRRAAAERVLGEIGQAGVSNAGLFRVLSTNPVLNNGTKYTAQMIPSTGDNEAWIRFDA